MKRSINACEFRIYFWGGISINFIGSEYWIYIFVSHFKWNLLAHCIGWYLNSKDILHYLENSFEFAFDRFDKNIIRADMIDSRSCQIGKKNRKFHLWSDLSNTHSYTHKFHLQFAATHSVMVVKGCENHCRLIRTRFSVVLLSYIIHDIKSAFQFPFNKHTHTHRTFLSKSHLTLFPYVI